MAPAPTSSFSRRQSRIFPLSKIIRGSAVSSEFRAIHGLLEECVLELFCKLYTVVSTRKSFYILLLVSLEILERGDLRIYT